MYNTVVGVAQFFAYGMVVRAPLSLLTASAQPVAFIFLLTMIGGSENLPTVIVGAIVYFAVGNGLADLPIYFSGMEKRSKFKQIFVASPIHPLLFIIAMAIGVNLAALPQVVVLLAVFVVVSHTNLIFLPLVLFVLLLSWIWGSAAGFYIGTKIRNPVTLIRVTDLLVMLLTVLAPVYYSADILPSPYRLPALVLPTSGAAFVIDEMAAGRISVDGVLAIAFLLVWAVVFSALVVKKAEWREM